MVIIRLFLHTGRQVLEKPTPSKEEILPKLKASSQRLFMIYSPHYSRDRQILRGVIGYSFRLYKFTTRLYLIWLIPTMVKLWGWDGINCSNLRFRICLRGSVDRRRRQLNGGDGGKRIRLWDRIKWIMLRVDLIVCWLCGCKVIRYKIHRSKLRVSYKLLTWLEARDKKWQNQRGRCLNREYR